jgi:RHS repeat-associated protein
MVANGPVQFKSGLDEGPTCFHGIRQTTLAACECSCDVTELLGSDADTCGRVDLHDCQVVVSAVDLRIRGRGFDWRFERTYRSAVSFDGPLGSGWEFSHNRRLVVENDGAVLRMDGYGRADRYSLTAQGYQAPSGYYTVLARRPDGGYVETDRSRSRALYAPPGADAIARLAELRDRNGNVMQFRYKADQLAEVVDTLGRAIHYVYNAAGQLTEVTDFAGRSVRFEYSSDGDLVKVTSPAVTGTSNGNDFPDGKTRLYKYVAVLPGRPKERVMTEMVAPNEAATDGPPYVVCGYEPVAGALRLARQTVGGVNAGGVPAGGTINYKYATIPVTDTEDSAAPVSQTGVIDRNGNRNEYQFNSRGNMLRQREFANRRLRESDPEFFETQFQYNVDDELTNLTMPEGNTHEYVFDTENPDRLQQGNLLSHTFRPDHRRGGDQKFVTTKYTYDPIYSQRKTIIAARGNDPEYVPQNGGLNSPKRYETRYFFDYQESADTAGLAAWLDIPEADVVALLEQADMDLGIGDVNGDGQVDQVIGNVVMESRPAVTLLPGSHMAGIEGGLIQPINETFSYNKCGQLIRYVDAERNVTAYEYYPEDTPGGKGGGTTPGAGSGPFGYLRSVIQDAEREPARDSKTNPQPIRLSTLYFYDATGNIRREVDARGIATDYEYNALNQLMAITRAADVSAALANPHEPKWRACGDQNLLECSQGMVAFKYRTLFFFDANDNLTRLEIENRDTNNGGIVGDFTVEILRYDILGNLTQRTKQLTSTPGDVATTKYRYDRNGNLVLTINPVASLSPDNPLHQPSNVTSSVFDERDLRMTLTEGGLTSVFLAQSANGDIPELDAIPNSAGIYTCEYNRDGNRNLIEINDGVNATGTSQASITQRLYDGFDRHVSSIDPLGNQTFREYDPAGNPIRTSAFGSAGSHPAADGRTGNPVQPLALDGFTEPLLLQAEHRYDEGGREFERLDYWALYDDVRYIRVDLLRACFNAVGNQPISTSYEYDRLGRLMFVVKPDQGVTKALYDGASRIVVANDPEGNVTNLSYDDDDNLVRMTFLEVTQQDAVEAGRLPDLHEAFTVINVYDSLNRLIRSTDPIGQTTRYQYDSRHNIVRISDAQHSADPGDLIDDPLGLFPLAPSQLGPTKINRPGNTIELFHDGANRPIAEVRRLRRNGQGRNPVDLTNPSNPDGLIVLDAQWDVNGRLIAIATDGLADNQNTSVGIIESVNPKGTVTRFTYTDLNKLARAFFPDGSIVGYIYTPFNLLDAIIDRNGSEIEFGYNIAYQLESIDVTPAASGDPHPLGGYKDPAVSWQVVGTRHQEFGYDGVYRIISSLDSDFPPSNTGQNQDPNASVSTYAYDSVGNVVEEAQRTASEQDGSVVSGCWDAATNRVSLWYPDDRLVRFSYDKLHRCRSVQDDGAAKPLVTYDYIGPRRLARREFQNGTILAYLKTGGADQDVGYDRAQRLVLHKHVLPSGKLAASFAYSYDRVGNKTSEVAQHENNQQERYSYDSASRLVSLEPATGENRAWLLDGNGNWASLNGASNKVNELNEYSKFGTITLQYDANGNVIDDGTNLYQYDAFNRLRSITRKADGAIIANYRYDAQNRRTVRNVTGMASLNENVRYYYDGWNEIQDTRPGLASQYVNGPDLDDLVELRQKKADGTTLSFFYHNDGRGNTAALTDNQGQIAERYRYDPYGTTTISDGTGNSLPASSVGNHMLFGERRYDPETGFYYFRNRYFNPILGRFLTPDPWGLSADIVNLGNGYTYVANNPVNLTDPLGLTIVKCNCVPSGCTTYCPEGGECSPTTCDQPTCDICDIDDGAGGVPSPPGGTSGPTRGGGGGIGKGQPPSGNRPAEDDQEKQRRCDKCEVDLQDAQDTANRNARTSVVVGAGQGIIKGCLTGLASGALKGAGGGALAGLVIGGLSGGPLGALAGLITGAAASSIEGAIAGCIRGGAVMGITDTATSGWGAYWQRKAAYETAQRAYDRCRQDAGCP